VDTNIIKYNDEMLYRCLKRVHYCPDDKSKKVNNTKSKLKNDVSENRQADIGKHISEKSGEKTCRPYDPNDSEPYGIGVGQRIECQLISGWIQDDA